MHGQYKTIFWRCENRRCKGRAPPKNGVADPIFASNLTKGSLHKLMLYTLWARSIASKKPRNRQIKEARKWSKKQANIHTRALFLLELMRKRDPNCVHIRGHFPSTFTVCTTGPSFFSGESLCKHSRSEGWENVSELKSKLAAWESGTS